MNGSNGGRSGWGGARLRWSLPVRRTANDRTLRDLGPKAEEG